ncbi:MAG: PKD domain-containing protein [Bacteroidales bacterium]
MPLDEDAWSVYKSGTINGTVSGGVLTISDIGGTGNKYWWARTSEQCTFPITIETRFRAKPGLATVKDLEALVGISTRDTSPAYSLESRAGVYIIMMQDDTVGIREYWDDFGSYGTPTVAFNPDNWTVAKIVYEEDKATLYVNGVETGATYAYNATTSPTPTGGRIMVGWADYTSQTGWIEFDYIKAGPQDPPIADFTATPQSGTDPLIVQFNDTSTGDPTTWAWNFGDGYVSSAQNPSHIYLHPGQYSVSLAAANDNGYNETVKPYLITVLTHLVPPAADFSASPTSGTAPLTVSFTDESTGATAWSWEFGDGWGSSAQNPTHTYVSPGTYTIILTAYNSVGSDVETKTAHITATEIPQPSDAILNGYGYDNTNNVLLDGVTITIENETYSTTNTTYGGGFYQFTGLSAGTYTIKGEKAGYLSSPEYGVSLYSGVVVQRDISLGVSGVAIVGTVYDATTGEKLNGANVTATQGSVSYSSTGAGQYALNGLSKGVATTIAATLASYSHTPVTLTPTSSTPYTVDLYLIPDTIAHNGTALAGLVTDAATHNAIPNAQVSLPGHANATTSPTGFYLFDDLAAGAYYVSASASGYKPSQDYVVTLTEGNLTMQDIELTPSSTSGTGWGAQYPPHNVQLKIMNLFGAPIAGVNVTATGYETTAESWDWIYTMLGLSTDIQIEGTEMTGTTGSDGCIDFMMFESVKYTVIFTKTGEVAELLTVYPHESYYPVYAVSLSSILNPFYEGGVNEYKSVIVNVSTSTSGSDGTITVRYQDQLNATTGGTVALTQTNSTSGEEETHSSYSISANAFSHDFDITDCEGQSYFVRVRATHGNFTEGVNRDFGVTFPGERLNFGLPNEILIWAAMFIMTVTALMFGPSAAIQGLPVICFEGWLFLGIGWLRDLGDVNAAGLLVIMSFVAVVANIMGASKRARQQG